MSTHTVVLHLLTEIVDSTIFILNVTIGILCIDGVVDSVEPKCITNWSVVDFGMYAREDCYKEY